MKFLLDTNVCVDYLNGRYPSVVERFRGPGGGELASASALMRSKV